VARVGLSLASYFVGISLGQLLLRSAAGPAWPKEPLYAGLALYIAATVVCMQARDINTLIILRFIQAVGVVRRRWRRWRWCGTCSGQRTARKVLSLLLLVLGALADDRAYGGWIYRDDAGLAGDLPCLLILGVVILALSIFFLPDSYPADRVLA